VGAVVGAGVAGFSSSASDEPVRIPAASTGGGGPTSVPEVSVEASSTTAASTTSTTPVRPPGEVTVLVANASGVRGAASTLTVEVGSDGYVVLDPVDAVDRSETTVVNFVAGYEREAGALAARLGLPAGSTVPMSLPLPVDDLAGAQIVVVLGSDRAG